MLVSVVHVATYSRDEIENGNSAKLQTQLSVYFLRLSVRKGGLSFSVVSLVCHALPMLLMHAKKM